MKYCSNCNTQNNDNANFCRRCGFAFPYTNDSKNGHISSDGILPGLLNDYTREIEELMKESKKLKNENDLLSKTNDSLQHNLLKIQKSISDIEEENEGLKRENEELRKSKNTIFFISALVFIVTLFITFSAIGNSPQSSNTTNQLSSQQNSDYIYEEEENVSNESDIIYDVVEQQPSFPGGQSALLDWLSNNIQYPSEAEENGIQGKVVVSFVVEPDGSISNVQVVRGVDSALDDEAIRVVSNMPNWSPGIQNGQAVRVKYFLPITYKLQ